MKTMKEGDKFSDLPEEEKESYIKGVKMMMTIFLSKYYTPYFAVINTLSGSDLVACEQIYLVSKFALNVSKRMLEKFGRADSVEFCDEVFEEGKIDEWLSEMVESYENQKMINSFPGSSEELN